MTRLLTDVDGVIVNFQIRFVEIASQILGRQFDDAAAMTEWDVEKALGLTPEEKDAVYEVVNSPGFAMNLPEMPGAVAGLKEVMKYADVYFLTSPNKKSPTWVFEREAWLVERFGEELGRKVIHTHHKYTVYGDIFIDDKPAHAEMWQAEIGKVNPQAQAYLWAWPFNEGSTIPRVHDWSEVADLVGFGGPVASGVKNARR